MSSNNGEKTIPPLFVLSEHSSSVLCCDFYPSRLYHREQSSWLLSGDVDGTVVLWNLLTRRPLASFSVLEEARRQLLDGAQKSKDKREGKRSKDATGHKPDAALHSLFSALGPHSRSVISVGFIPITVARSALHDGIAAPRATEDLSLNQAPQQQSEKTAEKDAADSSPVIALYTPKCAFEGPQRQRFRLTRRTSSRPPATTYSSPVVGATTHQTSLQPPATSPSGVCFYTHCRDQCVYIWSISLPCTCSASTTSSLRLMAALTAPQHGFCPVESVTTVDDGSSRTYLAVPHDSHGEITIWELEWSEKQDNAPYRSEDRGPTTIGDSVVTNATSTSDNSEEESDDAEEVDTTGMTPMDALIARAAAQEQREEKRHKTPRKNDSNIHTATESDERQNQPQSRRHVTPDAIVTKTERASFLCFVAPFATTAACGFSVRRLCSFSACPHFKGGIIMRLSMCADGQHLAVAFESGHVALARFRVSAEKNNEGCTDVGAAEGDFFERNAGFQRAKVTPSCASVRCAVRAFAESALACWWSGRRVLACSAEGGLHCYEVAFAPHESVSDAPSCATDGLLQLQLLWSVTLRKGIGSVCMQANLVVTGCWDSTLRLYDARDGRLVSILSYQQETINEVRMTPSAVARVAAFGFDARQPRCYAATPAFLALAGTQGGSEGASSSIDCGHDENGSAVSFTCADRKQNTFTPDHADGDEELVYVFASASKDGTVALWRIDMQLIVETAALKVIST